MFIHFMQLCHSPRNNFWLHKGTYDTLLLPPDFDAESFGAI